MFGPWSLSFGLSRLKVGAPDWCAPGGAAERRFVIGLSLTGSRRWLQAGFFDASFMVGRQGFSFGLSRLQVGAPVLDCGLIQQLGYGFHLLGLGTDGLLRLGIELRIELLDYLQAELMGMMSFRPLGVNWRGKNKGHRINGHRDVM